jgi:hypothetical protein
MKPGKIFRFFFADSFMLAGFGTGRCCYISHNEDHYATELKNEKTYGRFLAMIF